MFKVTFRFSSLIGFAPTHLTIKNGVRQMASETYLKLAKNRLNLSVRPKATATRVSQTLFNY